jgi:hypothetical protein
MTEDAGLDPRLAEAVDALAELLAADHQRRYPTLTDERRATAPAPIPRTEQEAGE